jgi:hypothetical protein
VDKITVVCHKDHDKGYEDFQGKCLLCVVDELMLEIGNLMIQKQRAERREWVGLTDEDKDELLNLDNWTDIVEAVEAKLKEKNT